MQVSPEKILIEMNLYDRLPDFLRGCGARPKLIFEAIAEWAKANEAA